MTRCEIFGRAVLAFMLVLALSWPSFARAVPMMPGMAMAGCAGHTCGDHQPGAPAKKLAGACTTAVCAASIAVLAPVSGIASAAYRVVRALPVAVVILVGRGDVPEPYPPR